MAENLQVLSRAFDHQDSIVRNIAGDVGQFYQDQAWVNTNLQASLENAARRINELERLRQRHRDLETLRERSQMHTEKLQQHAERFQTHEERLQARTEQLRQGYQDQGYDRHIAVHTASTTNELTTQQELQEAAGFFFLKTEGSTNKRLFEDESEEEGPVKKLTIRQKNPSESASSGHGDRMKVASLSTGELVMDPAATMHLPDRVSER